MKEWIQLFGTFAKIGAFTFGGGYAMLPMLQREIVEHKQWATEEELMDYFAIGQCTPGVIAVNTATFIGYKQKKMLGGVVATAGVIAPSLLIIVLLAAFLSNFSSNPYVISAFNGIQVCVCVQIMEAVWGMMKKSVSTRSTMGIFVVVVFLSYFSLASPVLLVIAAGLVGIVISGIQRKRGV